MLHLEQIERRWYTDRQAALLARAMGARVEHLELHEAIAAFEGRLNAEPEPVDPRRAVILRALGVAA